jgi:hypothetical protein
MKRVFFLTPIALAALSGCAPAPNQIQAGQWEIISEIRSLDIPGATAEELPMIRQSFGQVGLSTPETRCISDAEARTYVQDTRRGAPPSCSVSDERYANGVMHTQVSCPGQAGQPGVRMTLDGHFTMTTFNARIDVESPNPTGPGRGPMHRSIQLRAHRIGECTAPQPAMMPMPSAPEQAAPEPVAPTAQPAPAQSAPAQSAPAAQPSRH